MVKKKGRVIEVDPRKQNFDYLYLPPPAGPKFFIFAECSECKRPFTYCSDVNPEINNRENPDRLRELLYEQITRFLQMELFKIFPEHITCHDC